MANSRDVASGNGGGSGGSILINTRVLSGGHTGVIQALGGSGGSSTGGGAGGRIAAYYVNNHTHEPYRGSYDVYGGDANQDAEAGASGTVFLKHTGNDYSILRVDNKGQEAKDNRIENDGYRLDISGGNRDRAGVYTAASGVTVTTSCGIRSCDKNCPSCQRFALAHLFDETYSAQDCHSFSSHCTSTKLTFNLRRSVFINHIRVYPICNSHRSRFKVQFTFSPSQWGIFRCVCMTCVVWLFNTFHPYFIHIAV